MRQRHRLLALTGLALCVLLSACTGSSVADSSNGAVGTASANGSVAMLHRQGRWIVDPSGRVVLLHGVNAVWKKPPYYPPASAAGLTAADADFLADHGFNVVRLGVLFAGVMPQPGVIDANYLDHIQHLVQLLAARHIWVLLDFHQDQLNEQFQGEGFPPFAVDDSGLPNDANYGFPLDEFLSLALNTAYDNLWSNKNGVWAQYATAWTAVATRFRNQPYVLGYDLFNEPWPGSRWPTCLELDCTGFDATLQHFEQTALAGVRAADPSHFAFFEPQQLFDFGSPSSFSAMSDPELGLSWHAYCSSELLASVPPNTLPDLPDCSIIEPRTFGNAAAQTAAMGGAVSLLTEFGASDDLSDISRVANLADQHLVGWTYWAYKTFGDPTGSGQAESLFSNDSDLSTLKSAKADILIRPYAQATAGIPQSMSFDSSSNEFTLDYTPNDAPAPTVVFVPQRHYPNGYTVTVSGAHVVSAADATRLQLVNNPGAQQVQLTIQPK